MRWILLCCLFSLSALAQSPEVRNCSSISAYCWANKFLLPQGNNFCLDGAACTATLSYNGTNIVASKPISAGSASQAPNFTLTDATTGNVTLTTSNGTWIALDGTVVGAGPPGAGMRYNPSSNRLEINITSSNQFYISGGPIEFNTTNGSAGVYSTGLTRLDLRNSSNDGASALGTVIRQDTTFTNAGARILAVWNGNSSANEILGLFPTGILSLNGGAGYVASATPFTLSSFYVNGVVAAQTYGGTILPARAFTGVAIRFRNSTASSGAGSTTFRVTDGTNNCDFAVNCTATSGNVNIRQASTAGTCTFAASATLTYSVNATTCATTQPTVLGNVDVEGNWQ